jgi:hypothetical protein
MGWKGTRGKPPVRRRERRFATGGAGFAAGAAAACDEIGFAFPKRGVDRGA